MWCYISQPNSVVLEVEVKQRANGQECLEKVCEKLGIIELDYFGLQYHGNKGENLWLNMRNPIDRQLSGHQQPYRFQLRVKFFVQPHMVLQETTRHQMYLQVKHELQTKKLTVPDEDQLVHILALMTQVEAGNQVNDVKQFGIYRCLMKGIATPTDEILGKIAYDHSRQDVRGLAAHSAEYRVLQEAATLQNYGVEYHEARNSANENISVGVGPDGIFVYNSDMELMSRYAYPIVQGTTHNSRRCLLNVYNDDGETTQIEFKMVSCKVAIALYRCMTEMHSFFRCDTINNEVFSQVSQDLKGVLASIFLKEHNSGGQNYVFDVKHTCREVYDSTRRKLQRSQNVGMGGEENSQLHDDDMEVTEVVNNNNDQLQNLRDKWEKIQESFICRVCLDAPISTALCPCGHVCCAQCASRLQECHLCRTEIHNVQNLYLDLPSTVISNDMIVT